MTSSEEKLCIVAFANDNKTLADGIGGNGCHAADFTAIGVCGAFAYVSLMAGLYTCLCSVPKNKASNAHNGGRLSGHTVIWEGRTKIAKLRKLSAKLSRKVHYPSLEKSFCNPLALESPRLLMLFLLLNSAIAFSELLVIYSKQGTLFPVSMVEAVLGLFSAVLVPLHYDAAEERISGTLFSQVVRIN